MTRPLVMTHRSLPEDLIFYRTLIDNLREGIYFVDLEQRITYWNKGAERITGYPAAEVLGSRCSDNLLMHVSEEGASLCRSGCLLRATMEDGTDRQAEVYLHHHNGHRVHTAVTTSVIRDVTGAIVGAVETFNEIPLRVDLHRRIEELKKMAFADHLTEIANRRFLEMVLRSKLQEMRDHGFSLGVLFVDIDHFKEVNDAHGHDTGDQVLKMVAATLSANVRPLDIIGRWGGEEFLSVLVAPEPDRLQQVADRIRLLVEKSSLTVAGKIVSVTVSIGATMARAGETLEGLVQRADTMMYQSKQTGRNRVTLRLDHPVAR